MQSGSGHQRQHRKTSEWGGKARKKERQRRRAADKIIAIKASKEGN